MFYIQQVQKGVASVVDTIDGVREPVSKILPKMPKNLIMGNSDKVCAVSNKDLLEAVLVRERVEGKPETFEMQGCVLRWVTRRDKQYTVPYGIEKIHTHFPNSCERVVLPLTVIEIGSQVFAECCYLTDIVIPDSVVQLGTRTFFDTGLRRLVIPDSVKSTGTWCFACCVYLQEVVISKGMRVLTDNCFAGCFELKKVIMPEGIERIGCSCFENCVELENIVIPSTMRYIESHAFAYCTKLRRVEILSDTVGLAVDVFDNVDTEKLVLVGHKGSDIERYAKNHKIKFECFSEG